MVRFQYIIMRILIGMFNLIWEIPMLWSLSVECMPNGIWLQFSCLYPLFFPSYQSQHQIPGDWTNNKSSLDPVQSGASWSHICVISPFGLFVTACFATRYVSWVCWHHNHCEWDWYDLLCACLAIQLRCVTSVNSLSFTKCLVHKPDLAIQD